MSNVWNFHPLRRLELGRADERRLWRPSKSSSAEVIASVPKRSSPRALACTEVGSLPKGIRADVDCVATDVEQRPPTWAAECGRSDGSFASADSMGSATRCRNRFRNGGLVETPHLDVSTNPLCSYRPKANTLLLGVPPPKLL